LKFPKTSRRIWRARARIFPAALEALALEEYRAQKLSTSQLRRLLGYQTRVQVHAFLKQHGVHLRYTEDDSNMIVKLATGCLGSRSSG
jgi:Uncharacterised protein family (UPF0175)